MTKPKPTPQPEIRCSSLPTFINCPASMAGGMQILSDSGDAANIGNAAHKLLANYIQGEYVDIGAICSEFNTEPSQVAFLYYKGKRWLDDFSPSLKMLMTEYKVRRDMGNGYTLRGTADVVAEVVDAEVPTIMIIDWKTGRVKDCKEQLIGYAWLARQEYPEAKAFKILPMFLRQDDWKSIDIDIADIDRLPDDIIRATLRPDVFLPNNDYCDYCPRRVGCSARTAVVQSAVADLATMGDNTALTPLGLAQLLPKARMLEKSLKSYFEALKERIKTDGAINMGDGTEMVLSESTRDKLKTGETFAVIREHYPDAMDNFIKSMTVSKSRINKVIGDMAKSGETKKAARELFQDRLEKADAVGKIVTKSISVEKREV